MMNFTTTAEDMHAAAPDFEAERAMCEDAAREDAQEIAEAMREARGNDGVGIFPADEYGSLEERESRWAHSVLTGGE